MYNLYARKAKLLLYLHGNHAYRKDGSRVESHKELRNYNKNRVSQINFKEFEDSKVADRNRSVGRQTRPQQTLKLEVRFCS